MDIKKKYFDLIKEKIEEVYKCQSDKMSEVAALFGSCMENEGVVQLFGVAPAPKTGDVNKDGEVNIADVNNVIDIILND